MLNSSELSSEIKSSLEGDILEKADQIKNLSNKKLKPKLNKVQTDTSPNLSKYSVNFTDLASQGKFDKVVSRSSSINKLIEILCRRTKNNPVILGEAGVGKNSFSGRSCSKNYI